MKKLESVVIGEFEYDGDLYESLITWVGNMEYNRFPNFHRDKILYETHRLKQEK